MTRKILAIVSLLAVLPCLALAASTWDSATWDMDFFDYPLTAVITGTPPSPTNQTGATLTIGGDALTHYIYKLDGGSYSAAIPLATPITLTGLAAGSHTVAVMGRNTLGEWQLTPTTATWTIDTTIPPAPAVGGATPVSDTTPTWTWSSGGGNGTFRFKLDDADLNTGATETTATSFTPADPLGEGTHTIYIQERNDAGTWSAAAAHAIVVDTGALAPANLDLAAEDDSGASNTDNLTRITSGLTISGTAENGATVQLHDNGNPIPGATGTVAGGVFAIDIALAEGAHTLTATQTDPAGNQSPGSAALTVTVDVTVAAPAGLDMADADDSGSSNTDNLTKITTGLTISGTGENGAVVQILDNGTPIPNATATVISQAFARDITLAEGAHAVTAVQTDLAGNVSLPSAALAITVDVTAPGVSATPAGGLYNTAKSVVLSSPDPTAEIHYTLNGQTPTGASDLYFFPLPVSLPTMVKFIGIDAAGNVSAVKTEIYQIDTIPPDTPTTPTNNPQAGDDPTPTFVWNAVADAHHYLFQWSTNADFSSPATFQVPGTTYTLATALTTGGRYYWRVAAVDGAGNQSAWTASHYYDFIASSLVRKAVIVAGSGPTVFGGNLWPSTIACADFVYTVLSHRGYWPERMAYLSHQTTAQNPNVDALATNANLQAGISQAANADELVVYFSGHGEPGLFRMGETEYLSAATLDGWLDAIQAAKPAMKLIVIYDACFAGSFVGPLQPTGTQNRIVITSADADQKAWFSANGTLSFSWLFWSHVDAGDDVKVSFADAKNSVEYSYANSQTPLAEADGDGAANNKPDYNLMAGRFIGFDTVPGGAPVIGSVPADICLTGTASQLLQAQGVTGTSSLQRVWATILRPDTVLDDPENPGLGLPEVDLIDQGGGVYHGTYTGFDIPGAYTVTLMAKDVQGLVSNPKITVVVKDPVTGDLDHSGAVNLADAIIAAKATVGMPTGRTSACEDVNGDGKAGMAELVHALQKAAGLR